MGVSEEFLRLFVEIKGEEKLPKVQKDLQAVTAATYELAGAASKAAVYELVPHALDKVAESAPRAAAALSAVELAMEEVEKSSAKAERALKKVHETSSVSTSNFGGLQQRAMAASYAFQDFTSTSGDLGQKLNSVSNNISGIIGQAGPWGAAIATVTTAAIALYRNWDSVAALWEDRKPIEGLTETLAGLEIEVKKNANAIDDLRQKEKLNVEQTAEYNKLLIEQTELEAKLAEKREIEAAKKAHGVLSSDEAKGRATGVSKAVDEMGGFDAVVAKIVADNEKRYGPTTIEGRKVQTEQFERILNQAMKGNKESLDYMTSVGRGAKGSATARGLVERAGDFDPTVIAARKKVDELNELGLKNEEDMRKDLAKEAKDEEASKEGTMGAAGTGSKILADSIKDSFAARRKAKEDATRKLQTGADKSRSGFAAAQRDAEKGTVDEETHVAAAQMRAQGGYYTRTGKFVPLDEEGQAAAVEQDVRKRLPGLAPIARGAVAGGIAGKAFADVDREKADMMAGGMSEMAANQAIIANNQAIFQKQLEELRGMNGRTGRVLTETNVRARTRQTMIPGS